MNWESIAEPIRLLTDKNTPFPWPRNDAGRLRIISTLSNILPREGIEQACLGNTNEAMNRNLRLLISPYFKMGDQALIKELSVWIVKEWGGIKRGTEAIPEWCAELSDFNHAAISDFVGKKGTSRISSWSKIIAFASPSTDAIYDARTAVAINCALYTMGLREGFVMPLGRNKYVNPASIFIKKNGFNEKYGYYEYISLLNAMSSLDTSNDILDVEMSLFANAPSVANHFNNTHNP